MPAVNTHASSVVFYRHFKFLENKGYSIHILIDNNSYRERLADFPETWNIHILPNRKWFFPPYKPFGLLQKLRFIYYYQFYVKQLLRTEKINIIAGFIYGQFLSPFCAYVKKKENHIPLISFFHDDPVELNFSKSKESLLANTHKILNASNEVLIASEGFYHNWHIFKSKFTLLPPVPDYFTLSTKPAQPNPQKITFGYSGALYNEMLGSFKKLAEIFLFLGHELIIVGNNDGIKDLIKKYPTVIKYYELFETAEESNKFIIKNCNAYIIPYPAKIEEMPWIKTCFPSKLIQVTQLGLPIIIIASSESALGEWCIKKDWILYADSYNKDIVKHLCDVVFDSSAKNQTMQLSLSEFNPDFIHNQFLEIVNKQLNNAQT